MKKFLIAAAILSLTSMAVAQDRTGEFCGLVSEGAVLYAEGARRGVPWETMLAGALRAYKVQTIDEMDEVGQLSLAIRRESYYSWSTLTDRQIRALAFPRCMRDLRNLLK